MKPRHFLARIAAFVTAAAAIGMFLGPARADAADHQPDGSGRPDMESATAEAIGSRTDGWANRDLDIGTSDLWEAMAQELGCILDGWANPDVDIGSSHLWEAMAQELGSRVDGWANPDVDIGAF
jgi:hypothetical protein